MIKIKTSDFEGYEMRIFFALPSISHSIEKRFEAIITKQKLLLLLGCKYLLRASITMLTSLLNNGNIANMVVDKIAIFASSYLFSHTNIPNTTDQQA